MNLSRRDLPAVRPFEGEFTESETFVPQTALREALAEFAASPAARENLNRLSRGEARVIITGQQPCFPMPLGLTLQKTATAVALARRDESLVPVFWNGSDDSDFDEAAGQYLNRKDRSALRISLPASLERKGRRVGELPIAAAFGELDKFTQAPFKPGQDEDLGHFHGRIMAELFADDGLLVLEGRAPALAESAKPLWQRYLERRSECAASVDQEGDKLEGEGLGRPLRRGIGERALFFLKEGRRRLPPAEDYVEALKRRLSEAQSDLSPNVLLRPMLQNIVLPVEGVVLGPSEWLYHHQIRAAFELMDAPFPRLWPRLDAAGAWELDRKKPGPGGRESSPLLEPGNPLAQVEKLLELAEVHLEAWGQKHYHRLILHGEESP
ncbi:bacillithiol biosynthesis BshC [bacterium]|nr:bacillithiol biosynthesis BshC [bacterium]